MTEKRKRIEEKIFKVISLLDSKDGYNYKKYKDVFNAMSDEEFGKFCEWCNDPKDYTQLDHTIFIQALPFEEPKLENILKALGELGVPAEEYVTMDLQGNGNVVRSKYPIPVGYVAIKRMEQLLSKKNRYTLDNDQRSIKTDQVSNDSKVAAISYDEAAALITHGADKVFAEFYGARSSDESVRNKMYRDIALNGYVTLQDINEDQNIDSKNSLNTLDTYLLSAGLRTDLRSDTLKLPYTIKKELGK